LKNSAKLRKKQYTRSIGKHATILSCARIRKALPIYEKRKILKHIGELAPPKKTTLNLSRGK